MDTGKKANAAAVTGGAAARGLMFLMQLMNAFPLANRQRHKDSAVKVVPMHEVKSEMSSNGRVELPLNGQAELSVCNTKVGIHSSLYSQDAQSSQSRKGWSMEHMASSVLIECLTSLLRVKAMQD